MNANAYQLYVTLRSPFSRRIRLAVHRLNLDCKEIVIADIFQDQPELLSSNPLGMVPTLISTEDGPLSDSAHILEFLHEKTGGIWPRDDRSRTEVRQAAALVHGLIQSTVLFYQEAKMHETPSSFWMAEHRESIERTLKYLNSLPLSVWTKEGTLTQAAWDLGVSLEYLNLRFPEIVNKEKVSNLLSVLALARTDSYFLETEPKA